MKDTGVTMSNRSLLIVNTATETDFPDADTAPPAAWRRLGFSRKWGDFRLTSETQQDEGSGVLHRLWRGGLWEPRLRGSKPPFSRNTIGLENEWPR